MSSNNRVELTGFLGNDPKVIEKEGKKFVALRLATTDSYKDDSGQWQDKESVWHDVLVFRPAAVQFAEKLKKGDKVELIGSLSYKSFKDENGFNRPQATIIAGFVQPQNSKKLDEPTMEEVNKLVD
jgi:single-strand DNA-binding protein